jgi:drug/metabolite transporter (DMT)-like permease
MDLRALAMGLVFVTMWASAFTSARIIVTEAPPMAALSVRFLISGLIAVAIARALGQSWRLTPAQARATVLFGICQNALYLGLNFVGIQTVEASLATIIASTMPLLVAFAAWIVFGERLSALGLAGLAAGFAGVALIMGTRLQGGADPAGVALCFAGAVALGFATLTVREASSGGNVLMIVGLQMLVGSAALVVPAALFETWQVTPSWRLAAAFTYTLFVPGLAATLVWFMLVRRIGATRAATFHFLSPFIGVLVAAAVLGEAIVWTDLAGVAIIMAGILAVQLARADAAGDARRRV